MTETAHHRPTLVLGGTGKTGRRLVARLTRRHIPVRIGSRSAGLLFDWDQPSTWGPVFQDIIGFLVDLFGTVLAGRNAEVADGVERVLGRPARDFADYARVTAATGVWNPTDRPNHGGPR